MKKKTVEEAVDHANVLTSPLEEIMGDRFGRYSKYIIQEPVSYTHLGCLCTFV